MQTIDQVIVEAPAFAGLKPEYVRLIASWERSIEVGADEYVLREGERAQTFYGAPGLTVGEFALRAGVGLRAG